MPQVNEVSWILVMFISLILVSLTIFILTYSSCSFFNSNRRNYLDFMKFSNLI